MPTSLAFPSALPGLASCLIFGLLNAVAAPAAEIVPIHRSSYLEGESQPGYSHAAAGSQLLMSADGSSVVLTSSGTALMSGLRDLNGTADVFVRNVASGEVRLISHRQGEPTASANAGTLSLSLSDEGRYVLLQTLANDLFPVSSPVGLHPLLLHRDLQDGSTRLVVHPAGQPLQPLGVEPNWAMSADGRFVVYTTFEEASSIAPALTDGNNTADLLIWDAVTDAVQLISRRAASPQTTGSGGVIMRPQRISADGRYVAHLSMDPTLALPDDTGSIDAFLFDRQTGVNTLVSRPAGQPTGLADDNTIELCALSPDGRFLTFLSLATNLVASGSDTKGTVDLFLYDRQSATTELISRQPGGTVAAGDDFSLCGWSSDDGRYVYFLSQATNLIAGGTDSALTMDAFVRDRQTGITTLISHVAGAPTVAAGGVDADQVGIGADLSAAGDRFVFTSAATTMVAGASYGGAAPWAFVYELAGNQVQLALPRWDDGSATFTAAAVTIAADGHSAAFVSTEPGAFVANGGRRHDPAPLLRTFDGTPRTALLAPAAFSGHGTSSRHVAPSLEPESRLSNDGKKAAFQTDSREICGTAPFPLCLYDRSTDSLRDVNHRHDNPAVSASRPMEPLAFGGPGSRYLLVESDFGGLAASDVNHAMDVFLYDTEQQTFELISTLAAPFGSTGSGASRVLPNANLEPMSWAADRIVFHSAAPGLVAGLVEANGAPDVFLRDRGAAATTLVSHASFQANRTANGESRNAAIAGAGGSIVFESQATDLIGGFGDGNGVNGWDLYLYDVASGQNQLVTHAAGSATQGANANAIDENYVLSADGRFVAFNSLATNLIAGGSDLNLTRDVFLFDRATGQNMLVSHAAGQALGTADGSSRVSNLSSDGRYLLFVSEATDLLAGVDTQGFTHLYLWDRVQGTTQLVTHRQRQPESALPGHTYQGRLSRDGSRVVFSTNATGVLPEVVDVNDETDVYLWERASDSFALITARAGESNHTSKGLCDIHYQNMLSDDGRVALINCAAPDLTLHDTNDWYDYFLALSSTRFFGDGFESGTTAAWSQTVP